MADLKTGEPAAWAGKLPQEGDHLVVTLIRQVAVILNDKVTAVGLVEGVLATNSLDFIVFKTMRMSAAGGTWFTMQTFITINIRNIAGVWPVPPRRDAKKS